MTAPDPTGWTLPTTLPATLVDAALAYGAAGVPVFPCAPGAKVPLTKHGFHDATTDPGRIRSWWSWMPEANIALRTGTTVDVVDVDVHGVGTGFPVLRTLHRDRLIDGWGMAVRSPSGGVHLYYPSAPDRPQMSWSRGAALVDFRGTGGYILAPPSTITGPDGTTAGYEVIARGRRPRPVDADTLRDILTPTPPAPQREFQSVADEARITERLSGWVARLPDGNRNAGLFWAACRLAEAALSEDETTAALEPAAASTGLEVPELRATIHSAYRTITRNNGGPAAPSFRRTTAGLEAGR
ncbi:bifunctional DNA primase/polymerase [Microbacterium sp. NPDC077663]|uniref:bifunctional DNA primase/polymerase n=1 Tax=Microbacterium sp. NPDC077663 TaxID=3364189 RepID=UPI0037C9E2B9